MTQNHSVKMPLVTTNQYRFICTSCSTNEPKIGLIRAKPYSSFVVLSQCDITLLRLPIGTTKIDDFSGQIRDRTNLHWEKRDDETTERWMNLNDRETISLLYPAQSWPISSMVNEWHRLSTRMVMEQGDSSIVAQNIILDAQFRKIST